MSGAQPGEDDAARLHPSSSHEHQSAEEWVLAGVADLLGLDDLAPARLEFEGVAVELDGWSPREQVAVEVYAASQPRREQPSRSRWTTR